MSRARTRPGLPAPELLRVAAAAAASKKAIDVVGLDLSELQGVADYFLICSGSSEPQVKAIAEAVEEKLAECDTRPWHVEGREYRRGATAALAELRPRCYQQTLTVGR